ncbi:MAG: hypothetical protein J0L67_09920 [Cytophagales bacterium]|nr:hypothetical protein [Cytophagales bacterium]
MNPNHKPANSNSLILRVTDFGFYHKKFTLIEIRDHLQLNSDEYKFLARHLTLKSRTEQASPNHIIGALTFKVRDSESKKDQNRGIDFVDDLYDYERTTYMLLSSAYFSYIDHIEVVEARENARLARRSSNWAIGISLVAMVVSLALGLWQVYLTKEANHLTREAIEQNVSGTKAQVH